MLPGARKQRRRRKIVKRDKRINKFFLRSISIVSGIPAWSAETDLKNKIVQEVSEADKKIYLGENGSDIILLDFERESVFLPIKIRLAGVVENIRSAVSEFRDFHLTNKKSDPHKNLRILCG
jgi:hypothetical protein